MKMLTARQQQIYDLIKDHISSTGMPPTRAEIACELGFRSVNAAEEHLKALSRKGAIQIIPGSSRGIKLLLETHSIDPGLPLIGRCAAGAPILATEHIEHYVSLDPMLFRPHADYLLRIFGMSMKDVGIIDGDLLAVHKTECAKNGQIIVARIDNEVTVKRLERKENVILLLPENSAFEPIVVIPNVMDFAIEGLAVGIIRNTPWMKLCHD